MTREDVVHGAVRTLVDNWRGHSTVPAPGLYPHQWSWDSGFIALGLARWAGQRARTELASLFGGQWDDGRVPHIVFRPGVPEEAYFPGPAVWRSRESGSGAPPATSGIVQPPLHAVAALAALRHAHDRDRALGFVRAMLPRLAAQSAYLYRCRRVDALGLAAVVHPWETGMDNSPAWDRALHAVPADLDVLRVHRRRDLQHAAAEERPTDHDYARYVRLVLAYRDSGYDDAAYLPGAEFCVVDPLFNGLWAWAEEALAELATAVGADAAPHRERAAELTTALVDRLWRPDLGVFAPYDVVAGRHVPVRTVGGLVPLVLADLPVPVVTALVATATSAHFGVGDPRVLGVPSHDLTAADHDPRRYWRGPTWLNGTWLVWRGLRSHGFSALAATLADDMVSLVRRAGFREYFHPYTGEGLGTVSFGWSAALALDVAAGAGSPDGR